MRGGGEDQRTSTISSSCNLYPDYLDNHFIDMFQIHCREYVFFWFISKFNAAFENMLVCESFLWVIIIIFLSYHSFKLFKECSRMSYLLDCVIGIVSRWYYLDSGTCSCSITCALVLLVKKHILTRVHLTFHLPFTYKTLLQDLNIIPSTNSR